MQKQSREWFDKAYDFTGGVLPFAVVTGEFKDEDMRRISKGILTDDDIRKIQSMSASFYTKLPSEQDFQEEKDNILKQLVPELRERLPFVDTGIIFGRVIGDIDIGLIYPYQDLEKKFWGALYPGCDIIKKYPIVDWDTLHHFRSANGEELAKKIFESRYCDEDIVYIRDVISNARLLWGNAKKLDSMKAFVYS